MDMLLQDQLYPVGGNNVLIVDIGYTANKLKSSAYMKYHQHCYIFGEISQFLTQQQPVLLVSVAEL